MSQQKRRKFTFCVREDLKDAYEMLSIMVDSGASETVASRDEFKNYELKMTSPTRATCSSAAEASAAIVNKGETIIVAADDRGVVSYVKFQMCDGLSENKILGSVSRLVRAGHTVVFQNPKWGRCVVNDPKGEKCS